MKKFKVKFRGEKTYFANDIVTATKNAQKDITIIHPSFNMEVFAFINDES